jgi:hypothetical protein
MKTLKKITIGELQSNSNEVLTRLKDMKSLILILFLWLTQALSSQSPALINISPVSTPTGKLMAGDLVESMEYVPLETKDNCVIGRVASFDVSKNYILIYCYQTKAVYLFKRNGRFISKISHYGQGPEEYTGLLGVFIDESKQELILCSFNKHLFYNLSGNYLRKVNHLGLHTSLWMYYNNKFLSGTPSGVFSGVFPVYKLWTMDMEQKMAGIPSVSVEHKTDGGVIMTAGPAISSFLYEGKPHVRETALNDTVYVVTDNNIVPKYILSTGKYGITPEEKGIFDLELLHKSVNVVSVAETKSYILFQYKYKRELYCAYYIKATGRIEYFDTKEEGIPNNYDGGLDFWPVKQVNDEWYCFYNAYDFMEKSSRHKAMSPIISTASSQKYKSLSRKLDSEDNPVLVIIKIKK